MLTLREFQDFARLTPAEVNRPKDYFRAHNLRFHATFKEALTRVPYGGSILSIGAGRAYVECALAETRKAKVTVFDFPEAIARNSDQYKRFGFRTCAGNFLDDEVEAPLGAFNCLMFCEIVEHIPLDPAIQFAKLKRFLKPSGCLIVTTPNIGSAAAIIRLLRGDNVFAGPKKLFSPVRAENESVHRREYTLGEIVRCMKEAGLTVVRENRIHQTKPNLNFSSLALFGFTTLFPRLRQMLIVTGRNG
jgi:2-polyprenyl-3-methyl-5-hydroxy-6-metoxy-1,4-benzoquinol methylase